MATTRKEMARDSQRKAEQVKLPTLWKFVMYTSLAWVTLGAWLYSSGVFALNIGQCAYVGLDNTDEFMATSIAFAGIVAIGSVIAGIYFLENQRK